MEAVWRAWSAVDALRRAEGVSRRLRVMGRSGYVNDGEMPCTSDRPIAGDGEEM